MIEKIKKMNFVLKVRKTMWYSRLRQHFPMCEPKYVDDRDQMENAEIVKIQWPAHLKKPVFGIVQDFCKYPKWTKYRRFLENNLFDYDIYPIHSYDWIERATDFDIIIGIPSNSSFDLCEIRSKYEVLETYLGKFCYPSSFHARLYEDKCIEAYISKATGIPFANTYVCHDHDDALKLLKSLKYPLVSKIVPSSGSMGVELVKNFDMGKAVVRKAFSNNGRKTHLLYSRQKNNVYFQEFIPNHGFDMRVIVVGNWVLGYEREIAPGDFRASGMQREVKRELPEEAMRIALKVNKIIKSPVLAVDMLKSLNGTYKIIEFSPLYQMDSPGELQINGIPGVYIFENDGTYHFQSGKYWVAELALKEFIMRDYLPFCQNNSGAGV